MGLVSLLSLFFILKRFNNKYELYPATLFFRLSWRFATLCLLGPYDLVVSNLYLVDSNTSITKCISNRVLSCTIYFTIWYFLAVLFPFKYRLILTSSHSDYKDAANIFCTCETAEALVASTSFFSVLSRFEIDDVQNMMSVSNQKR
jgi:hypothetical protein